MFGIKKIQILLCFILALSAFFIGSWYGIFLRVRVDPNILEDMVNKSQWVIRLSPWKIGDDVLYMQAGTKYVQGALTWQINPETPPLAKLGYGLGQVYLSNPYVFSFFCMIIFLLFSWKLICFITNQHVLRLSAFLVLCTSPLVYAQLGTTMLELPVGVFILFFLAPFFRKNFERNTTLVIISGLGLGFAAACKFPLYPAILGFVATLWITRKSLKHAFIFVLSSGFSYLLSYIPFLLRGMSLVDVLKNQWWMVQFYRQGSHDQEPLKALIGILFGIFNDNGTTKLLQEWSPWWPVFLLSALIFWSMCAKKLGISHFSILDWLCLASLAIIFLTPYQARYFFLPFLLLFFTFLQRLSAGAVTEVHITRIAILTIVISLSGMLRLYARGPVEESLYFSERWSTKNYRDIGLMTETHPWQFSPDVEKTLRQVDEEANLDSRTVLFQDKPPLFTLADSWTGMAAFRMLTPQGSTLGEIRPITFHRIGLQWIISWDEGMAFPGYEKGCTFEAVLNPSVSIWQNWFGFVDLDREAFKDVIARQDLPTLSEVAAFTDKTYTQFFHTLTLDRADKPTTRWVVTHPTTKMHQLEGQMLPGLRYTSIYQNTNPLWERTALGRKVVCPTKGEK